MKKTLGIAKGIIGYIVTIILTILFALFLNANVGWYMLIALTLAPVLSVFFAWLTRKTVDIEAKIDDSILEKGDKISMHIVLHNRFLFPTTPIEIKLLNAPGVNNEKSIFTASVLPFQKKEMEVDFTAKICGKSVIGIEAVAVNDFLGVFKFKKKIDPTCFRAECKVLPKINDISSKDDRIIKVMQDSLMWDDGEDTKEKQTVGFGGFPGYDKREYVPGDPIKRINWKQSAKTGKLYVRLDEEVNATSVNVVLDGYFDTRNIYNPYVIAEDAIENTLGIAMTMVKCNYKVNFYVKTSEVFECFNIEEEKDVENLRYVLAGYEFSNSRINRLPDDEIIKNRAFVLSTPNPAGFLPEDSKISVFSAFENQQKPVEEKKKTTSNISVFERLAGPFLLAIVLSIVAFDAFDVSVFSVWTILEFIVVGAVFALCEFAGKRKFIGFLSISLMVIGCLFACSALINPVRLFLEWFLSGGDSGGAVTAYLMVILLFFTVFFGAVIYFYTQKIYRTSALMFVSMMAFLIHVKVMRDVEIGFAMVVVALNVLMFVLHNRKETITKLNARVSLVLYMVMFVLLALAVPKSEETRYYYLFEQYFLRGNKEVKIPSEYVNDTTVSGNADNIKEFNNRKLYEIKIHNGGSLPYLRNNVYDVYDYSIDRWRGIDAFSERGKYYKDWENTSYNRELDLGKLYDAILLAEKNKPGFLEKYGLEQLKEERVVDFVYSATVKAWEFDYRYYICPVRGKLQLLNYDKSNVLVLGHNAYYLQYPDKVQSEEYDVWFRDEYQLLLEWNELGLMNYDTETSLNMLKEMASILVDDAEYLEVVNDFINETEFSQYYSQKCEWNNSDIPESIRNLAMEITKDCQYDWEKAWVLSEYFSKGFYYDIYYDAPDDSVEYFLFEGKTGTCSDFASAYVLMARAVGLTVRYVEGYVPQKLETIDDSDLYEIRAENAHAYPEVFIQNVGYVVFEPTRGQYSSYLQNTGVDEENIEVLDFAVKFSIRTVIIFAAVAVLILIIFFVLVIFGQSIKEYFYIKKTKKLPPKDAVIAIYKRLLRTYLSKKIKNIETFTPDECAELFKNRTGFDIEELTKLVIKTSYEGLELTETDRQLALEIYIKAKKMLRKSK